MSKLEKRAADSKAKHNSRSDDKHIKRYPEDAPANMVPLDETLSISVPGFEGPLDLLLHLIRAHTLDILDLPMAFVAERYVSYLKVMEALDLDVASEYLLMAATLTHIKSKMLLPKVPDEEEMELDEQGDPREALIKRLLEYQKYKQAASDLGSQNIEGRDVFLRGVARPHVGGARVLAPAGLFKLLGAFERVMKKVSEEGSFEISGERVSIQERMTFLIDRLKTEVKTAFDDLFEEPYTRYDVVVTFLALLEMGKQHMLNLEQDGPMGVLYLSLAAQDD